MARSKRVKLKMLDDDSTSKLEREENLRAWIIASREEEHKISLWKRYPKLSSSWSERNSVFRFFVKDLLERNPIVGVVGNDKIVLAVEKNSTDSGFRQSTLSLHETPAILAFAGKFKDGISLATRTQMEIYDYLRPYKSTFPISPEFVALKVAGILSQVPYCLFALILGFDPYTSQPGLFAADPRGRVGKFAAYAIGRDLELRNKFLRNNYKEETFSSSVTSVKLAIRAFLEVGKIAKENIEVAIITRSHGRQHDFAVLEQAMIDAICIEIVEKQKQAAAKKEIRKAKKAAAEAEPQVDESEIQAEKVASEAPTHIRAVEKERKKAAEAEPQVDESEIQAEKVASEAPTHIRAVEKERKKAAEAEPQVDESEIQAEKVASEAPTHIRAVEKERKKEKKVAAKKERRKAKKAAAEAATKALSDEPSIDVTAFDQMDLPEEQVDEIEIREEKGASDTIPVGKFGVKRRELEKMGAEKAAAEVAPLVDVAVADQMALPKEPKVDEIEIREEKAVSETNPFCKFGAMRHGLKQLEEAKIDAIYAEIETKKAASKAPTHIRAVVEQKKKKKAAAKKEKRKAKKAAAEVEPQVDELEIQVEKVASKAPTHIRAIEKERKKAKKAAAKERTKAKKAAAEAATKALPDEPLFDVTVSDKMDLPEEQVDEIEIKEEKAALETIHFDKFGVMRRELEKMGVEKAAAEAAPLVDVAVADADQMAISEEPQVDEIEIRKEKAASEAWTHTIMPISYGIFGVMRALVEKMRAQKAVAEAAKKAPLDKLLVDLAYLMALLEKPQVDEIKIGKEKAGYETLRYIMPMPFRRLMSKVEKMRAEKAAAEGAKKAP